MIQARRTPSRSSRPSYTGGTAVRGAVFPAVAVLAIALLGGAEAAAAQESSTTLTGRGSSHWGEISAPTDSTTGRFTSPKTALWEYPLLVPYWAVRGPLKGLAWGTEGLVGFASGSATVREIVEYFVAPRRVKILPSVQAGGVSGAGGGLSLRVNPFLWSGSKARGRASATLPGELRLQAGILGPLGSGGEIQFGAGFRRRPNARFFGLGPESRASSISLYESEEAWVGGGLLWSLSDGLAIEGELVLSRVGAFTTDHDEAPPLEVVFDELPTGFGRFSDGLTSSLALFHESASQTARPRAGGVRQLQVSFFRSGDQEYSDHWAFRAEAQQFLHLVHENQVLALRGLATWIDPTGASVVPFQRLVTSDTPDLLRGHDDFRFRDRGLAVLSAEYRWPLWVWAAPHGAGVDMYLLSDVGQVFHRRRDLAFSRLSTSWGFGFRLVGAEEFVGRLEVARSEDGWVFRVRGEQIFQFARGGLYYGRSRVPNR